MSCTCNGICYKVEVENNECYSKGGKFCPTCDKFLLIFSSRCLCCNDNLRVGKRNKKSRGFLN